MEIELKLLVSAGELRRIARTRAVAAAARGRPRSAMMRATYYDTDGLALLEKRITLRVRREGRRWKQTVKAPERPAGGLHRRLEYEWPLKAANPDLEAVRETPFAHFFAKRKVGRRLRPAFDMAFRRRSLLLDLPDGAQAVLALDEGAIDAGRRSEPICEAEIELVQGSAAALLEFAARLLEEVPFRIGHHSKAERGYALVGAGLLEPHRMAVPELDPESPAGEACLQLIGACASQLHANEEGFLRGADPEYLHQMRVAMRRLRVALAMPREPGWRAALAPLQAELRWASGMFGQARNWDVFAGELLPPLARACGARRLAALRGRVASRRRAAVEAAREAVRSARYQRLNLALARLCLGEPFAMPDAPCARDFARRALARRYARLAACPGPVRLDDAALHQLRIEAKKTRYLVEFFSSLYPKKKVKRFTRALGRLQDLLGAVNDAFVSRDMIEASASGGRRSLDREAVGLASGWIAAQEAAARRELDGAWSRLRALDPYWA